jgi:hypothetical protein
MGGKIIPIKLKDYTYDLEEIAQIINEKTKNGSYNHNIGQNPKNKEVLNELPKKPYNLKNLN